MAVTNTSNYNTNKKKQHQVAELGLERDCGVPGVLVLVVQLLKMQTVVAAGFGLECT